MIDSTPRTPERMETLTGWLSGETGGPIEVTPASEDASFRRYFRVCADGRTWIAMDAPPEHEDCRPFVDVTQRLLSAGVGVPRIHAQDLDRGFLLLDDFGDTHYLKRLRDDTADALYGEALAALVRIQSADAAGLAPYDEALLRREMALFPDWLLGRHLGIALDEGDRTALEDTFSLLVRNALEQPRVFVHRDYHSRNLMVLEGEGPGVLDYQDAVLGPVTYDLVSLLRDCYIAWPWARVQGWTLGFRDRVAPGVDDATFLRWFELMGAQRHLKAAGIFARLCRRDGKPGFLADIPRTLGYLADAATRHAELRPLARLIERLDVAGRLGRCAR